MTRGLDRDARVPSEPAGGVTSSCFPASDRQAGRRIDSGHPPTHKVVLLWPEGKVERGCGTINARLADRAAYPTFEARGSI